MYGLQLELEECKCLARMRARETNQTQNNARMTEMQDQLEKLRKELQLIEGSLK